LWEGFGAVASEACLESRGLKRKQRVIVFQEEYIVSRGTPLEILPNRK
jgi:hypothetical protein